MNQTNEPRDNFIVGQNPSKQSGSGGSIPARRCERRSDC